VYAFGVLFLGPLLRPQFSLLFNPFGLRCLESCRVSRVRGRADEIELDANEWQIVGDGEVKAVYSRRKARQNPFSLRQQQDPTFEASRRLLYSDTFNGPGVYADRGVRSANPRSVRTVSIVGQMRKVADADKIRIQTLTNDVATHCTVLPPGQFKNIISEPVNSEDFM